MGNLCSSESRDAKKDKSSAKGAKEAPAPVVAKPSWAMVPATAASRQAERQASRNPDDYLASGLKDTQWVRLPGEINDQRINIEHCSNTTFVLMDQCDSVQIDECVNCRFFIGPTMGSVFVRNCKDCTVIAACGQLRTRDVHSSQFALYCQSRPVIESSRGVGIGCFPARHCYFQLLHQLCKARLSAFTNLHLFVHDFTPRAGNYTLLPPAVVDAPEFFPLLSSLVPEHVSAEEDAALFATDVVIPCTTGTSGLMAEAELVIFAPGAVEAARRFVEQVELGRRAGGQSVLHFALEQTFGPEVPDKAAAYLALLGVPATAVKRMAGMPVIMVVCSSPFAKTAPAVAHEALLFRGAIGPNQVRDTCPMLFAELPTIGKGFGQGH